MELRSGFFSGALVSCTMKRRYACCRSRRRAGGFPSHSDMASHRRQSDGSRLVLNDYLGMGPPPKVIGAMVETANRTGNGAAANPTILTAQHPLGMERRR